MKGWTFHLLMIVGLSLSIPSMVLQAQSFTETPNNIPNLHAYLGSNYYHNQIVWGDYDNDGDLDVLLAGQSDTDPLTQIYRNDSGTFTLDNSAQLPPIVNGDVAWGDYDNDGDLDIVLTGFSGSDVISRIYRNDGSAGFTDIQAGLTGLGYSSTAWGDYDNDGDLDVVLTGNASTDKGDSYNALQQLQAAIFENQGNNTFVADEDVALSGIGNGSVAWGDFDQDGKMDLLFSGQSPPVAKSGANPPSIQIYRNLGDGQMETLNMDPLNLQATDNGNAAWADYNNNGYLDLLITGTAGSSSEYAVFYQANSQLKEYEKDTNAGLKGVLFGEGKWGDYNNDNFMDIVITGFRVSSGIYSPISYLYQNESASGNFSLSNSLSDGYVRAAWGDYNQDSQLDLLFTNGNSNAPLYTNNSSTSNTPTTPSNLQATPANNSVLLTWDAATHANTYNLRIGTSSGGNEIMSGMANETGQRLIAAMGNVNTNTQWVIDNLPDGTYYWSVQSIAANFGGSSFTQEASFTIGGSGGSGSTDNYQIISHGNNPSCGGISLVLEAFPQGDSYEWYNVDTPDEVLDTYRIFTPQTSGTYNVRITSGGSTASPSSSVTVVVNPRAELPDVPSVTNCGAGVVTLSVENASASATYNWYDHSISGNLLHTGTVYEVGVDTTETYYVSAVTDNGCPTHRVRTQAIVQPLPEVPRYRAVGCGSGPAFIETFPKDSTQTTNWYTAISGGSPLQTSLVYETDSLSLGESITVYAATLDTYTGCESTRTAITVTANYIPELPTNINAPSRIGAGIVTLTATPGEYGNTCVWFDHWESEDPIYIGTSFTDTINVTTFYYLASYNSTTLCVGERVPVKVQVIGDKQILFNPDQIYPIPSNSGTQNEQGVNLFTGNVNQVINLGNIESSLLSFSLDALYNSRTVALYNENTSAPYVNELGGLGWKLLGAPNIIFLGGANSYEWVTGYKQYEMKPTGSGTNEEQAYTIEGEYHSWKALFNTANQQWTVTSPTGTIYTYNSTDKFPLPSNYNADYWSISTMQNAQKTDMLTFNYVTNGPGNRSVLQSIIADSGDQLQCTYNTSNGYLNTLTYYQPSTDGASLIPKDKKQFNYEHTLSVYEGDYPTLSSIDYFQNMNTGSQDAIWATSSSSLQFAYYEVTESAINPNALKSLNNTFGGTTTYTYGHQEIQEENYYPVMRISNHDGYVINHTSIQYETDNAQKDHFSHTYIQYNLVNVFPGTIKTNPTRDENMLTSFETSKASDPIFNFSSDWFTGFDYYNLSRGGKQTSQEALSGNYSYLLDETYNFFENYAYDTYLRSKKIYIGQQVPLVDVDSVYVANDLNILKFGKMDSVMVNYYWYPKYDNNPDFVYYVPNCTFYFYDAHGDKISTASYDTGTKYYKDTTDEEWRQEIFKTAVPIGAAYFTIEIIGGYKSHGKMYLDDVSVIGASQTLNGQQQYFFFNEGPDLKHLPAEYYQDPINNESLVEYGTGFETTDYKKLLDFSSNCKPDVNENIEGLLVAFNGSKALNFQVCSSHTSSMSLEENLTAPKEAHEVFISFRYSSSRNAGMSLAVTSTVNGQNHTKTTEASEESYYVNTGYRLFNEGYSISEGEQFNVSISVDEKGNGDLNDLFIDDLNIRFVKTRTDADNSSLAASTSNETYEAKDRQSAYTNFSLPSSGEIQLNTNPRLNNLELFSGKPYHARTLKSNNEEMEAHSWIYSVHDTYQTEDAKYLQVNAVYNTQRGAATAKTIYGYNEYDLQASSLEMRLNTNPDDEKQRDTIFTATSQIYAFEQYPELNYDGLHILTPITANNIFTSTDQMKTWTANRAAYTQWAAWDSTGLVNSTSGTTLNPWRSFTLSAPISISELDNTYTQFRDNPSYTPDASKWLLVSNTQQRNAQGNYEAVYSSSTDSISSYVLYSQGTHILPVATFGNANPNNAFYTGFENYETVRSLTGSLSSTYAHTGMYARKSSINIGLTFQNDPNPERLYVFSGWILTPDNTTTYTATITDNTTTYVSESIGSFTPGTWTYFEIVTPLVINNNTSELLYFQVNGSGANANSTYFDNIRFSPADGSFSALVYDPNIRREIAALDNKGGVSRIAYNQFDQVSAGIGTDQQPLAMTYAYASATQHNDTLSVSDPNFTMTIAPQKGGAYYLFNDPNKVADWDINPSSNVAFSHNEITLTGNSNKVVAKLLDNSLDLNNLGMRLNVQPISSEIEDNKIYKLGIGIGAYKFEQRIGGSEGDYEVYYTFYDGQSYQTTASTNASTLDELNAIAAVNDWLILVQKGVLLWYVNGQLLFTLNNVAFDNATDYIVLDTDANAQTQMIVSDIVLIDTPQISIEFLDGMGKSIQRQIMDGNNIVVEQTIYDENYRPFLQTLAAELNNAHFGYQSDFVTSFDFSSGKMTGSVNNAQNYIEDGSDDVNYFYNRTLYQHAPQTVVSQEYNPGKDFALRNPSDFEKATTWIYDHKDEIIDYAFYAADLIEMIIDPASAPIIIAMDVGGIILEQLAVVLTEDGEKEVSKVSYFYDEQKRLIQVKLPYANLDDDDKDYAPSQIIEYSYDFAGNRISETTPESGTSQYAYDYMGRMRFYQDASNAENGTIRYTKYNPVGLVIEEGYFEGTWNSSLLATMADDASQPNATYNPIPVHQYFYNGQGTDKVGTASVRGEVTKILTYNLVEDSNPPISEQFSYNTKGETIAKTLVVYTSEFDSTSYTTQYTYNNLGAVTRIDYPETNEGEMDVCYTYNNHGAVSQIAMVTPTDSTVLATYTYHPDGSIQEEQLHFENNTIGGERSYNAPGWLTKLLYPNLYEYDMNYNFADWWESNLKKPLYNGDISSMTYKDLHESSKFPTMYIGLDYDASNNLSTYSNNVAIGAYFPPLADYIKELIEYIADKNLFGDLSAETDFDLNGNFNRRSIDADGPEDLETHYHFHHPNRTLLSWRGMEFSLLQDAVFKDSVFVDYAANGFMTSLRGKNTLYDSNFGFTGTTTETQLSLFYSPVNWLQKAELDSTDNKYLGVSELAYKAGGIRAVKFYSSAYNNTTTNSAMKTYVHGLQADPLMERTLSDGAIYQSQYYIYGPSGLLGMHKSSGDTYFVLKDQLGSTLQLVDQSNQSLTASYAYDDYGNLLPAMSSNTDAFSYLYTGQEYDAETNLHNFKARMYSPNLRLFLSPDPAQQNPMLPYAYVGNNPINRVDPDGRNWFSSLVKSGRRGAKRIRMGSAKYAEKYGAEMTYAEFMTSDKLTQFLENYAAFEAGRLATKPTLYMPQGLSRMLALSSASKPRIYVESVANSFLEHGIKGAKIRYTEARKYGNFANSGFHVAESQATLERALGTTAHRLSGKRERSVLGYYHQNSNTFFIGGHGYIGGERTYLISNEELLERLQRIQGFNNSEKVIISSCYGNKFAQFLRNQNLGKEYYASFGPVRMRYYGGPEGALMFDGRTNMGIPYTFEGIGNNRVELNHFNQF